MRSPACGDSPGALIFDLDGTLVDSYGAIAESLNHARARYDLPPLDEATVRRAVGRGLESLISEWVGPQRVEAGVRLFRERYADVFERGTRALDGVGETLSTLSRSGLPLSVASNKPARFSRRIVESLGWSELFVTVEGPDTAGRTKPDPAMMRRCMQAMAQRAEDTLYVGDMELDVESARRAGVACVLVCGGSSPRERLETTGSPVLERLDGLLPLLESRGWLSARRPR